MNTRTRALASFLLSVASVHCSGAVTPSDASGDASSNADVTAIVDASPDTQLAVDAPSTDVPPTATCAQVQATCTTAPQLFVRGHAEGLTGLDGARVQFAMRYILEEGMGIDGPHGVVTARSVIVGGSFEACVCVPRGASNYPQSAAVVFAPGSTGELGRDVVRGSFSQRFATLGDEDFSMALAGPVTPAQAETALAAMAERSLTITLRGLDAMAEGGRVFAGLVADERPITALVGNGTVAGGVLRTTWNMPGRAWPSERLAVVVDRNRDNMCNDGDFAASIRLDGRTDIMGIGGAWLEGAAIQPVCDAIRLSEPRGT